MKSLYRKEKIERGDASRKKAKWLYSLLKERKDGMLEKSTRKRRKRDER